MPTILSDERTATFFASESALTASPAGLMPELRLLESKALFRRVYVYMVYLL
jgi:hypothetical protein